ncbi:MULTISPECIES: hypothetical protein [unclassified Sinorhizobium]|uniref:hypothetical protein n=1 Tax=unclassified Sinorhizobium TaxID=2613772 RepID=UPI0035235725
MSKWVAVHLGTKRDIERGRDFYRVGPENEVRDIDAQCIHVFGPRKEERARLAAAAPDLLSMLKVAQLWLDVDGRFDMQGINAAIAKAEGRS